MVEGLVGAGANINAISRSSAIPLLVASDQGHVGVVETLLAAGANRNTTNKSGATPLYLACQKGHGVVVESLLATGANLSAKCGSDTPISIARKNNHPAIVALLSQSLPAATVANYLQRIAAIQMRLKEIKDQWKWLPQIASSSGSAGMREAARLVEFNHNRT